MHPFGGSALARDAVAGALGDWYAAQLSTVSGWKGAAEDVAREFAERDWLGALEPALEASGNAARRLGECASAGGVVVTTGQQPGLFGGPLYVLHKALTALALADTVQERTGIKTAPIFWAATDDTDFAEANHVGVVIRGSVQTLGGGASPTPGQSMSTTPLGDVSLDIERLAEACGSAANVVPLAAVRDAYRPSATVGGAYVLLLRDLLEPLGIAVLDAAHPAVRRAGFPTVRGALERAEVVRDALQDRSRAVRERKYRPQVADVAALSLVFATDGDGLRQRVPVRDVTSTGRETQPERFGPNVLLRPIMERAILPTVAYVGGPGEVAYFAQVSAVADAIGARWPRIVPRWSGTLIEPHVHEILSRLHASVADFRDPHAVEGRVAREGLAPGVRDALAQLAEVLTKESTILKEDPATSAPLQLSVESMRRGVEHRLGRLERRYAAAVKRSGAERLHDVAAARASLFPDGEPQERVLSFVPFLSKYGVATIDAILNGARQQMSELVSGG